MTEDPEVKVPVHIQGYGYAVVSLGVDPAAKAVIDEDDLLACLETQIDYDELRRDLECRIEVRYQSRS